MEPAVEEVWSSGRDGSNLLGLPGPCPWDDDDEPLGLGGIKPKSSPIPRRRSSEFSCSDDESQPPPSSSRRVSFADAFGLSLVSVKKFDSWGVCGPSDPLEGDLNEVKEYFLSQLFTPPSTQQELIQKVQENKLELESLELLPGTTTLKGIIRVLNLSFEKMVYIRTSLDCWSSHFDLLAEYIPGLSGGDTDCFSFRLTLVPPFGEQGARVDFCLRYETPCGTFWSNNKGQNYVLFCHERRQEQGQNEKKHTKKSCLKSTSHDCSSESSSTSNTEEIPEIILNCGMAALAEPVKEDKIQEESSKLQEETIRNRSKRSRRKAARLAKVKQYFAEREEKDIHQFDKDSIEAAVKVNVENPVPEEVEAPLNLSTPQKDALTEMQDSVSLSPAEEIKMQKCTSTSVDTDSKQVPPANIQTQDKENIPASHCELTTCISQAVLSPVDSVNSNKSAVSSVSSVSQALENSQNKETLTGQTASVSQQPLECQTYETSINKNVEKAWECFEKGAMGRMGSTMDIRMGEDTTSSEDDIKHKDILENKPDIQPSGHNFTFETIVAPLYHQVFERMESERRDFINTKFNAGRSARKWEDECLRTVTYQSYPRTQSPETRPNSCISKKHDLNDGYYGTCRDLCPTDLFNTKNTTKEPPSGTNVNRELAKMETPFHDLSVTDKMEPPVNSNVPEPKMSTHKQQLSNSLPLQLECLNLTSLSSLEECIPNQKEEEQNQERINVHSECCLPDSTLEDPSQNASFQSKCPPEDPQQEDISVDYMVLTTQPDLYRANVKTSPTDSSATHISFETGLSTELTKIQGIEAKSLQCQCSEGTQTPMESTFNEILPSSKCLEESHRLIPDSSSFYTHITSNVMSNFNQDEASEPSQNLTSLTPIQMPDFTSFEESQKAAGTRPVQFQSIEVTDLTQGIENISEIIDGISCHVGKDTKTNSDRNKETDDLERTHIILQDNTLDRTLLHPLPSGKELSSVSKSVLQEKEADIFNEHKHVEYIDEKKDLKSTDKEEYQTMQVSEEAKELDKLKLQPQEVVEEPIQKENKEQKTEESEHEQQDVPKEEEKQFLNLKHEGKEEQKQEEQKEQTHEYKQQEEYEEQNLEEQEDQGEQKEQDKEEELEEGEEELEQEQQIDEKEKLEEWEEELEQQQSDEEEELEEQQQSDKEEELEEQQQIEEKEELVNNDTFEDELLYIDDDDEEDAEKETTLKDSQQYFEEWEREEDLHSLIVEVEEQDIICRVSTVGTLENTTRADSIKELHPQIRQELQKEEQTVSGEKGIQWDTDSSKHALTGNHDTTFSDTVMLINKEEEVCFQTNEQQVTKDAAAEVNKLQENLKGVRNQSEKNVGEDTSTESLSDEEMDLYLHQLKISQKPGVKDTVSSGNYCRRSSLRTMHSRMPSISESVDEDQPNASLEDLTNEEMTELEFCHLEPLVDEEEEMLRRNVLWWRELFSSDNMSKMIGCTFLLVVFLVTAYYYDFVACFGLYLLALYWLYFRGESEPFKITQPNR
ncbi:hypothetical protein AMEX_G13368 [Astyanax mexicanus]|uniref:CBM21 domain-containing protein n=1 Tax=Astyanax mexicanus TaxID=7994 RepID=A0A8T2LSP0_ASTMX|nr:hypothetical protein AMEX_G13368 [Astyanax mexicanus]